MNLSQLVITFKRHTHLASAVLVDKAVEFPDKNHGEAENRVGCLSLDQVVASHGVDLSGEWKVRTNELYLRTC